MAFVADFDFAQIRKDVDLSVVRLSNFGDVARRDDADAGTARCSSNLDNLTRPMTSAGVSRGKRHPAIPALAKLSRLLGRVLPARQVAD